MSELKVEPAELDQWYVSDLMKSQTVFLIPSYQRGYRWTGSEAKKLMLDLYNHISGGNTSGYCLQPIVLQKVKQDELPECDEWRNGLDECNESSHEFFRVVDGQQRLTTLALIYAALGIELNIKVWLEVENEWLDFSKSAIEQESGKNAINAAFRHDVFSAILSSEITAIP